MKGNHNDFILRFFWKPSFFSKHGYYIKRFQKLIIKVSKLRFKVWWPRRLAWKLRRSAYGGWGSLVFGVFKIDKGGEKGKVRDDFATNEKEK